ncbi:MAG TPA: GNAT family N-acetyltransferase [Anaerolineales bacterium]|nr:GNAT family N-acetyltransferase [Anaerolineales bacterium]
MSLSIQPVTIHNWRDLSHLQVREDQKNFVAPNIYSIAESQFGYDHPEDGHWDMAPYGIYDGGEPVGFLMIGYNFSRARTQGFIIRLMVDEKYQGKGYGKFGMHWILDHFRNDERIQRIGISYEPDNEVARTLYASLGFVETGEIDQGEVVAELQIR